MLRAFPGGIFLALTVLLGVMGLTTSASNAAGQQPDAMPPARLALEPCRLPGLEEEARCGTYEVYEDREARKGRKLRLKVAVLPALTANPASEPLFFLAGGPGQAATAQATFVAQVFAKVRRERDIVLVDQRGTGSSHALNCDLPGDDENLQGYLGEMLPVEAIQACRVHLERAADLTLYTTPVAMDDLDEIRAALGYGRINLYGTSYGTRAALVYLRRYPEHVRSVILKGVAPMNFIMLLHYARDAQRALELLFEDCTADQACRTAFPELRWEFHAVLARLEKGPVRVEIPHPSTDKRVPLAVSRAVFAETLRNMLYSPAVASQVPLFIHRAFENDFAPFVELSLKLTRALAEQVSLGMFLSVTCAEDIALIASEDVARETQGTFLGDYRVRQQMQACKVWPRGKLPPGYRDPVHSEAPALIISGGLDPVTPPRWGEEAARYLPNSLHVVIPKGGHPFAGLLGCVDNLMAEFISKGSIAGLDTSCAGQIRRPPFVLPSAAAKP